jgi:transmembrane sensor
MKAAQGMATTQAGRFVQAAEWVTRLRDQVDLSADELRSWQHFIASPENLEAFHAVQRVANAAPSIARPSLPSATELMEDNYDGAVSVRRWKDEQTLKVDPSPQRRTRTWKARWLGGAAAVATGATLALCVWLVLGDRLTSIHEAFHTQAAEHRLVMLSDGSKIALGAKTTVDVRYSATRRLIHIDRGEALFTVAHNRSRPFVVLAGARTVTAVGTEFDVWRDLDRTTVTVTDGTVDVKPIDTPQRLATTDASPPRGARVSKGQRITYAQDGVSTAVEAADLSSATAWREGRLVYRHVPLKYVISDVNRYFKEQFEISDRAVGELQFSGAVLQTQSAGEFLHALESIFPVEAIQIDSEHIVIRARASAQFKQPVVKS